MNVGYAMRFLVLIICVYIAPQLYAQQPEVRYAIKNSLVKDGFIKSYSSFDKYPYGCPSGGVPVFSTIDSAFAFQEAEIVRVFKLDDDFYAIVTRTSEDHYITYSNIKSTSCKKGDVLSSGSFIGQLLNSDNDDGYYQLDILIMAEDDKVRKRRKSDGITTLSYEQCTEYILGKMGSQCVEQIGTAL